MLVKEILDKSDEQLEQMLTNIGNEPVEWTPVILSELTRRGVFRLLQSSENLRRSSERLEKLTKLLIGLTLVLALLAVPPIIDFIRRVL